MDGPLDQEAFDEVHCLWCQSIIKCLASRDVPTTYGRAAKRSEARQRHPPADRRHSPAQHVQGGRRAIRAQNNMAKSTMDTLDQDEYYRLIHQLRIA
jgi:hypothetical protein